MGYKKTVLLLFLSIFTLLRCTIEESPAPIVGSINTSPTSPLSIFPGIGEKISDTSCTFQWECSDADNDSLHYTVLLDTITPPKQIHTEKSGSRSLLCENLTSGTHYYWRVIAYDGSDSTESSVFSFSVEPRSMSDFIEQARKSCYIIGVSYEGSIFGLGSGFAVSKTELMTNAHVVNNLRNIIIQYGPDQFELIAVQDGGTLYGDGSYVLDSGKVHPQNDVTTVFTYDFGLLKIASDSFPHYLELDNSSTIDTLTVGSPIFTIGFPGETNDLNTLTPLSTYKNGTISSIRPMPGSEETNGNAIIQHNLNTTGGTSGSPIFNDNGQVIAVHNSGAYEIIYSDHDFTRIPVGAISYAIRADLSAGIEEASYGSFSDVTSDTVTYRFINGTWTDLSLDVNDINYGLICYQDTLEFWDYRGYIGYTHIALSTLFKSHNFTWRDTLPIGNDFEHRYFVDSSYFLLGIFNRTPMVLKEVTVENRYGVDSAESHLLYNDYSDVGYFRSDSATHFRCWYYDSKIPVAFEGVNSVSDNSEAKFIYLEPSDTIPYTRASITSEKMRKRPIRTRQRLSHWLQQQK